MVDIYTKFYNVGGCNIQEIPDTTNVRDDVDKLLIEESIWTFLKESLCKRESTILEQYFRYDQTLKKTGLIFGIQGERVRQIKAKALQKCRHPTRALPLMAMFDLERYELLRKKMEEGEEESEEDTRARLESKRIVNERDVKFNEAQKERFEAIKEFNVSFAGSCPCQEWGFAFNLVKKDLQKVECLCVICSNKFIMRRIK